MNKFVKYLLCIFFSILAINFLVNLIGFFKYNSSYLIAPQIKNNLQSESLISTGKELEEKYKNHKLINDKTFKNCCECHIESDWLLVYKIQDNELILLLFATGSHSDLFNK